MTTILIVDDRPINRQFLTTLLGYKGYRLREASDGAEALEWARAEPPDLIITDLLMPTMDGFELIRQLRADPALAATPVILYTAKFYKEELRDLLHTSGVQHLDKPSDPEEILHAVEHALTAPPSCRMPLPEEFQHQHLRLVTDKLAQTVDHLELSHLRLTALGELNRQLSQERDPHSVLEHYCHGARRLIVARYALVLVLDDDRRTILHFHTSGLDQETLDRLDPSAADLRLLGKRLDNGHPLRLRDGRAAPEVLGLLADELVPHSLLIVPSSREAALLMLVEKLGAEEFSAEDERIVMTLTAQMTLSYENAKLRDLIQQMNLFNK